MVLEASSRNNFGDEDDLVLALIFSHILQAEDVLVVQGS
jgi:hypothetical protein